MAFAVADAYLLLRVEVFLMNSDAASGPALELSLQDVQLGTTDTGEQGVLVMRQNKLVAVLTRVDQRIYDADGEWFLEIGFGRLGGNHRLFASIEEAKSWIGGQYDKLAKTAAGAVGNQSFIR